MESHHIHTHAHTHIYTLLLWKGDIWKVSIPCLNQYHPASHAVSNYVKTTTKRQQQQTTNKCTKNTPHSLYGVVKPLQMIQNAAARLVFNQPKRAHVTPLLIDLHWLPVAARIKF